MINLDFKEYTKLVHDIQCVMGHFYRNKEDKVFSAADFLTEWCDLSYEIIYYKESIKETYN